MAVTNNNKKQVDLPIWEWCDFQPFSSAASYCTCADESSGGRYIYYLGASSFYRYDTYTDMWQQLSSPNTATATVLSMRYSVFGGYRGNIINADSTTATIAGLQGSRLVGNKIRLSAGTGAGQERTIIACSNPVIVDHGVVTSAAAASLTDTTKHWRMNEHIGKQVRLVYGTGQSQVKKILYNDATNLYVYDANFQYLEAWNNRSFSAVAPYALPVSTAGSQTHYYIETSVITINTPWITVPDASTSYVVLSGGVWALSSVSTAPWSSFQYYDVLSDTWTDKTAIGGNLLAALGTDITIERTGEQSGSFDTGSATAGSAYTLTAGAKTWVVDRWVNYQVRAVDPATGLEQRRRIVGNTATVLHVEKPWVTNPTNTYTFTIFGNTNAIYLAGNGQSSLYEYMVEEDLWVTSHLIDSGVTSNITAGYIGQQPFGITSITRNTGGITAINPVPTAGGSGYVYGDILTISTGGTLGKVFVETVSATGAVLTVSLYGSGLTYTTGTGKATTGGTGTLCTIEITTVGNVGRVVLVTNDNLCIGDQVSILGATDVAWNTTFTIIGHDALGSFDILATAAATAVASFSQGTTLMVDPSKNWGVNEHAGKILSIAIAGVSPTHQLRRITSNTATTITVATIVAGANGTSRYTIQEANAFGKAEQWRVPLKSGKGWATGGGLTTLVDNTKSWYTNQWVGYRFQIITGTGRSSEIAITSNTSNTLTYATQAFTPDATSKYIIMDTYGLVTGNVATTTLGDTTKLWTVNQWAGKRVRITAGLGQSQEATIASNTATVLTFSAAVGTAPDTTSYYTILEMPVRGAGIAALWTYGNADPLNKGNYIFMPRGSASNVIDRYNISTNLVDQTACIAPQGMTFTTGTMYSYDNNNRIYITKDALGYVVSLDIDTLQVSGAGRTPYAQGTAVIGNRMEVVQTVDGLKYLYVLRHSASEFWRTLLFW